MVATDRLRNKRVVHETASRRLDEDIRRSLQTGVLKPNDRLRSHEALAAEYGIGLHVVRQTIKSLKAAGYLYSKPKSGVYAAPPGAREPGGATNGNGLHVFDIVSRGDRELTFLIAGWHDGNRAMWQRICRDASGELPGVLVKPLFPATPNEYDAAIRHCDVFMSTPWDRQLFRGQRGPIEPIAPSEFRNLPLDEAHIRPVMLGENAVGIPLFGTLFFGAIHPSLATATQRMLATASSWTELMPLLARVHAERPDLNGLNLHCRYVLTLYQYLRHVGGELVDGRAEMLIGRAD
ncbi:MAG: winged helix-turn-helix domain-containing protein, partial [Kiritimatiellae bacterium]|nr:winged helix-turn-helix domain-containing protein [Kiritimatiellia bacterium]